MHTPTTHIQQIKDKLGHARVGFDPGYEFSDDYDFWFAQRAKAWLIRDLTADLAQAQADMQPAEVSAEAVAAMDDTGAWASANVKACGVAA